MTALLVNRLLLVACVVVCAAYVAWPLAAIVAAVVVLFLVGDWRQGRLSR